MCRFRHTAWKKLYFFDVFLLAEKNTLEYHK